MRPISEVELLLPGDIPDYTDFYASIDHATNVGTHVPARQSAIAELQMDAHRLSWPRIVGGGKRRPGAPPWGQVVSSSRRTACLRAIRLLDYEMELGAFLGPGNPIGEPIPIAEAEDHLVGVCLLNDWSARDIQSWEYQPLGPFLGKNFATSISPWVVTMEALQPFRCASPPRPEAIRGRLSPHLWPQPGDDAYGITLEVGCVRQACRNPCGSASGDFSSMYWTLSQMIAHHSSNGCPLRPGDLIGSGTVSGPEKQHRGCLLELTWRGAEPYRASHRRNAPIPGRWR